MADDDEDVKEAKGPPPAVDPGRYDGPAHASPYGLTRLAPSYDLVDVAAEIQRADETLATITGGKLALIAEQMEALRAQARGLLERARRDAELHRAKCRFEKKPGGVYHLYRRDSGERWFSLIAPDEWSNPRAHRYEGTYRLESDMSFTRVDEPEDP